jgi:hypothetical protein
MDEKESDGGDNANEEGSCSMRTSETGTMDWEPSSSDKSFSSQNSDVSDLSLNYVTQYLRSPQGIA